MVIKSIPLRLGKSFNNYNRNYNYSYYQTIIIKIVHIPTLSIIAITIKKKTAIRTTSSKSSSKLKSQKKYPSKRLHIRFCGLHIWFRRRLSTRSNTDAVIRKINTLIFLVPVEKEVKVLIIAAAVWSFWACFERAWEGVYLVCVRGVFGLFGMGVGPYRDKWIDR